MPEGTIKKIVADRGFGFIQTGQEKDLFFHFTACEGVRGEELEEGRQPFTKQCIRARTEVGSSVGAGHRSEGCEWRLSAHTGGVARPAA